MKKTGLLFGVLLALAVGFLVWQRVAIRQLQTDNDSLRRSMDELQTLREENARLAKERIDPAELERLRAGQSELVRLRGQVAQLRRQVAEAASKRPATVNETAATAAADASTPPVETYTATVEAVIPWSQTLVYGGWTLPSGKRAMVFIRVDEGDQVGQVTLQSHILEMPESVLTRIGWDGIKAGDKKGGGYTMVRWMSPDYIKTFDQLDGVDVLSAPRVITADGRQAQVKVVDVKTAPSGEQYELGPTIDLTPKISADRASVQLNVTAQLRLPSVPAK